MSMESQVLKFLSELNSLLKRFQGAFALRNVKQEFLAFAWLVLFRSILKG